MYIIKRKKGSDTKKYHSLLKQNLVGFLNNEIGSHLENCITQKLRKSHDAKMYRVIL